MKRRERLEKTATKQNDWFGLIKTHHVRNTRPFRLWCGKILLASLIRKERNNGSREAMIETPESSYWFENMLQLIKTGARDGKYPEMFATKLKWVAAGQNWIWSSVMFEQEWNTQSFVWNCETNKLEYRLVGVWAMVDQKVRRGIDGQLCVHLERALRCWIP